MFHNISANKYFKAFCFSIIVLSLILLSISLQIEMGTDDEYFLKITDHANIIDLLINRYQVWSGRVVLDGILLITIHHSFFWKIAIPLSLLLLSASISKIVCQQIKLFYTFVILLLLFSIPLFININAAWWITGFYIYLLPLSLATYVISFMLSKKQSSLEFIIVCLLSCVFAYAEQIGIYFFVIVFVAFIGCKRTRNLKNFCIYILVIINFIVSVTAPGNYVRLRAETWSWFPDYNYYSLTQKLCFGFDKLHQVFGYYWNVPLIVLIVLLALLYIVSGKKFLVGNISLAFVTIFISVSIVQWNGRSFNLLGHNFLNATLLNAEKWISMSTYVSYLFVMMVIISIIILIISTLKNNYILLMVLSIFLVGILDTVIVGFSPTIYASGLRLYYVFEVCCVMNCMFLIHYLYQYNQKDSQNIL